jgi:outer membrane protein TolC
VVHTSSTIPIDLTYQTDVWGSIRRSVAENSAIAQASAAELENARLLYQAELASDYFQIQGLDAQRQLLDVTVKSYEQYVQLTQDRYDGGVASKGDVAQAQTQLETARAELVDLGVQRAQFEHAIAVLTGKPPSDLSIPLRRTSRRRPHLRRYSSALLNEGPTSLP